MDLDQLYLDGMTIVFEAIAGVANKSNVFHANITDGLNMVYQSTEISSDDLQKTVVDILAGLGNLPGAERMTDIVKTWTPKSTKLPHYPKRLSSASVIADLTNAVNRPENP